MFLFFYSNLTATLILGGKFRAVLNVTDDMSDIECGQHLLNSIILVHLTDNREKFNLLIHMLQKLYSLVAGECAPDNPDSPQHQEVLLSGFLYAILLKEKLEDYLLAIKTNLAMEMRRNARLDVSDSKKNFLLISRFLLNAFNRFK
jgi:DNA-directed RNA polymerase I subunit RPA2